MNDGKIGPRPRVRFKLLPEREKRPSGGTFAFPNRPELYRVLAPERDEER